MKRKPMPLLRYGLGLLLLGAFNIQPALGAEIQSLDSIREAARQLIASQYPAGEADTRIEIGSLDPRLRLSKCSQPLETFFPQGSRSHRPTVGVRCSAPKKWTIYVSAEVHQMVTVWVASDYLPRGSLIQQQDFTQKQMDLSQLRYGYYTDFNEVSGKTLKRHLARGAVLTPAAIAITKVIKRGEHVTIIAETGGIMVRAAGQALEDGGVGDIIRVKNLNSRKVIEARVDGPGRVKINF